MLITSAIFIDCMKCAFTLLAFFLSAHLTGQPYLNETSQWKQYFQYYEYPPGYEIIEDIWIKLDGDTTIEGTTYFKVLKTGFDTTDQINTGGTDTYGTIFEYLDPIREGDKSIFAFNRKTQKEYLLYDFSAAVGDTLMSGKCKRDSVLSIDTVYLGDVPRRQFHLPTPYPVEISTLVEGIGSTFGFYIHACNIIPNPVVYLQCFCQDGSCIKFKGNYDCSSLLVANQEINENAFSILPNPFIDEIEIHFPDAFQHAVSIVIVNLLGAVVFEEQRSSPNAIERIALPDLPAAMYVVSIRHQYGITSQKMMKL